MVNLSNPLESLLKPAQVNVLLAFLRLDERLTGRQVARITGSHSASGTRDTLLQLAEVGLLIAEPTPHATYYSLNRDHLLWPAVEQIANVRGHFTDAVAAITSATAPSGTSVLLYGSTARFRSTAKSDIDVLVVFPDGTTTETRDAFTEGLALQLRRKTGNRVEVFDVTEEQLDDLVDAGDPMVDSWRAEAELLAGPGPRQSIARVA